MAKARGISGLSGELTAQDEDGPEFAMGDDITRSRPYLETELVLCDVYMKDHTDYIEEIKKKWND